MATTVTVNFYLRFLSISFGIIVLVLLPSYSPFLEISYNSQRVYEIVLLAFVGLSFMVSKNVFHQVNSKQTIFGIVIILLLGIISSLLSRNVLYGFLEIGLFILVLAAVFFTVHLFLEYEEQFVKAVLITLAATAFLYLTNVTYSYIQSFFVEGFPTWPSVRFLQFYNNGEPLFPEPFLGFVHVRYLNHMHTWSLPLFALMVVKIPRKYWAVKWCAFALSCLWWMLVFAADARGTMLGSFLAFIFVAFLFRKKILEWIKVYAGSAGIGMLLYLFFFKLLQSGGRTILTRYSDSGRWQMWENALGLVTQNPVLGAGPMHYADYANGFRFAAPHNIYLQIASEWGLIAFGILAFICVSAYIAWIKFCKREIENSNDKLQLSIMAALTASITAAAIHGFFTGIINTPMSQILMVIVLGWAIGFYQLKNDNVKETDKTEISKWKLLSVKAFLLIAVVYVSGMTWYSYQNLDESRNLYLEQSEKRTLYPRYWGHGIIGVEER